MILRSDGVRSVTRLFFRFSFVFEPAQSPDTVQTLSLRHMIPHVEHILNYPTKASDWGKLGTKKHHSGTARNSQNRHEAEVEPEILDFRVSVLHHRGTESVLF